MTIATVTKCIHESEVLGYHLVYDDGTGGVVPIDENNRHYKEILEWIADGNTPAEPA